MANIASIERALASVGEVAKSSDPNAIQASPKIVLPGVGTFPAAMAWLRETGVADALRNAVAGGASLLGICVGHQLLFEDSDEMGLTAGLGLCRGKVRRFDNSLVAVPQIGWNRVSVIENVLFEGIPDGTPFYFVNSYRAVDVDEKDTLATASYGEPFVAAVGSGSVCGVQFHPEKSSDAGLRVLRNFVTATDGSTP